MHLVFVKNCPVDKPYVQRGDNSTVPKFNAVLEWPIVVGPVVARHTVPYKFGSRAVTTYTIALVMLSFNDQPRTYKVSWFCTSNKGDAWLVFG